MLNLFGNLVEYSGYFGLFSGAFFGQLVGHSITKTRNSNSKHLASAK